ncbi:MAG: HK97 family phage prohead protease [Thermoplasmata archaeon]
MKKIDYNNNYMKKIIKDEWWRGIKEAQIPRGWTQESFRSAWESLGGDFESVADAVREHFDSPEGFAAWLHYQAFGKWPREKEIEGLPVVYSDDDMMKVLRKVLEAKKIDIPHPATRLASNNSSVWKPVTDATTMRVVSSGSGALILGKSFFIKDVEIPFEFQAYIEKVEEKEGKYYVIGIASDTRVDKDEEIISENALREMMEEIKKGNVVLLPSHKADWDEEMGKVVDAEITPNNELKIVAELDMDNELSHKLVKAIKKGKKLGMSIGGVVKRAFQKFIPSLNKVVRVIDSLILKHIAVTGRPANPRTWLTVISKSIEQEVMKYMNINKQEELVITPDMIEELEAELEDAIKEGDAEAIAEAKKKLKEAKKKLKEMEGKKEAEAEAEAESEVEARCKELEAKIKESEDEDESEVEAESEDEDEDEGKPVVGVNKTYTIRLTAKQYKKVKEFLAKEKMKNNPIYKAMKDEIRQLREQLDEIKKSFSGRKSIITKTIPNDVDIVKEFKERVSKIDTNKPIKEQEKEIDKAFKENLLKILQNR